MQIHDIKVRWQERVVGTAARGTWDDEDDRVTANIAWAKNMQNNSPLKVTFNTLGRTTV